MAIDGFDFATISDGRVDPDSPLDTTLTTDYRDNLEFLMRWLGKSFLGAAVADHDHDGLNSAKVDVADLTGGAIDNGHVWVDDGTSISHGLTSIASQVPVDTVSAEMYMEVTNNTSSTGSLQVRQPGSGTYRDAIATAGTAAGDTIKSTGLQWIPVNSSRQIDTQTFGATNSSLMNVRGYSK